MTANVKLAILQIAFVAAFIVGEAVRSIAFKDYYENPLANLAPWILVFLLLVWIVAAVFLTRVKRESKAVPKWCQVVQLVVGLGLFGLFVSMAVGFAFFIGF